MQCNKQLQKFQWLITAGLLLSVSERKKEKQLFTFYGSANLCCSAGLSWIRISLPLRPQDRFSSALWSLILRPGNISYLEYAFLMQTAGAPAVKPNHTDTFKTLAHVTFSYFPLTKTSFTVKFIRMGNYTPFREEKGEWIFAKCNITCHRPTLWYSRIGGRPVTEKTHYCHSSENIRCCFHIEKVISYIPRALGFTHYF
jgi:hypothetical protein